jgi:dipeptidyl aminopeptidase/acylaminoacyl peptidase
VLLCKRRPKNVAIVCIGLAVAEILIGVPPRVVAAQVGLRRFTVADDIGLTRIATLVAFSPDQRLFIVTSDRGNLGLNRPQSSVRVYLAKNIRRLLAQSDSREEPSPLWTFNQSTYKEGPIISVVRWLPDSSGFAFLAKTETGKDQLFLANPHTRTVKALTDDSQSVRAFAVHSETQFVYAIQSATLKGKAADWERSAATVGTGQNLFSLIFPAQSAESSDRCELWAVVDGKRFPVVDSSSQRPVTLHSEGLEALALSPDGHYLVTAVTVATIPPQWETLYPPPIPSFPYRVRAGRQDPDALNGAADISEYVLIDLASGTLKPLAHAPTGSNAGWAGFTTADWSADGKSVVMSDTFLPADPQSAGSSANRPCVAVADLSTGRLTCVERRREQTEQDDQEKWRADAHFVSGKVDKIIVRYESGDSTIYARSPSGWRASAAASESVSEGYAVDVQFKQDLNHPPVLVATDKQRKTSRIVWIPNPQLKDIELGGVSVFKWKDKTGHDWIGGLYKPPDYIKGKRYPLVIQTHGFDEHEFQPGGPFTTAFAAQELAATGLLVLQVEDCNVVHREEGACQVAGYEAAVSELAEGGLVDAERIGIIGFSRTCFYVMEALTTRTLHFKAASITDGAMEDYFQYLLSVDISGNGVANEYDAMVGARPFGEGLQQWLKRSPLFNMDKVSAALQVVAEGRASLTAMWGPYAAMRYLNKPVDLIVLSSDQHELTNPSARMASQGGTVDWFRFWLQDYEDPDPAKAEQYVRWRELRKLQVAQDAERANAGKESSELH